MLPKHIRKLLPILERKVSKVIPFRTHYRPAGTYENSYAYYKANRHRGAAYAEVYPDLVTRLPIPKDFYEKLSPYKLYDKVSAEDKRTLIAHASYRLVKIPGGRIVTDNTSVTAVISQDNKLVRDVSFQFDRRKSGPAPLNEVFHRKYFPRLVKFPGTVFTMLTGGGGVHNYAHWLMDVLPCIYLLKEAGWFDSVDWFLVPNVQHDYQRDSLKFLGIDPSRIISGTRYKHLEADAIIASTPPRGQRSFIIPDWVTQLHRKYLLPVPAPAGRVYPERVYISRNDSRLRRVLNEAAVVAVLQEYGFEVLLSSQLSFAEKIHVFNKAHVIVSASGAGLTSLFFGTENAKVLELFSQGFVHTHYYNIAHSAGMEYYFLVADHPDPAKTAAVGEREDITVDIAQLRQVLQRMFAPMPASMTG